MPPPSLAFVFASLTGCPPLAPWGWRLFALRSLRATRVRSLRSPLRALAPWLSSAFCRLAPSGASLWGVGGWLLAASLLGGVLAAPSAAPASVGRGSLWSLVCLCGGVPCSFLLLRRLCCRLALPLRRGLVVRLACRSALLPAPCPGSWRLCASLARLRLGVSPLRGVGACRPLVAVAWCARFPVALRSRCRLRRFARWVVVAVPAPSLLWLRVAPRRWRPVASSAALVAAPAPLGAVVGFSGGRRLPSVFRPLVAGVAAGVAAAGRSVVVGCAGGADCFVRSAVPAAAVFRAASFGSGRPAFAARSVALVRAVAAGGTGSGLVVFPAAPCPAGLLPSSRSSACFCGLGSGSWASAAFAAGLGLRLVVFPCGFSALPPWGVWRPLAGAWSGGFLLVV